MTLNVSYNIHMNVHYTHIGKIKKKSRQHFFNRFIYLLTTVR